MRPGAVVGIYGARRHGAAYVVLVIASTERPGRVRICDRATGREGHLVYETVTVVCEGPDGGVRKNDTLGYKGGAAGHRRGFALCRNIDRRLDLTEHELHRAAAFTWHRPGRR